MEVRKIKMRMTADEETVQTHRQILAEQVREVE